MNDAAAQSTVIFKDYRPPIIRPVTAACGTECEGEVEGVILGLAL
jgi:hypothetical protein